VKKIPRRTILKTAVRLSLFFFSLFLILAACGPDPFYIPVEFIEGVPETGEAGAPLTLTGNVRPHFASNKNIVWSVKNAGTTGASISGNTLNASAIGTVTIRAMIANGMAEGKEFTQDFKISIMEAREQPPVNPGTYFDVAFETNGGNKISSQKVEKDGNIQQPTNPVKAGYIFDGWYKEKELINPWDFYTDTVTKNLTLYAKWIAVYTVTFNANGGNTPASQVMEAGSYAQRPDDPVRAGFGFVNWYSNPGLTTIYNFDNPVTGNITLYARWIEYISKIEINVIGPMKGDKPNTTASAEGVVGYTIGAVSWSPLDDPFKGNTQYTATVTVTAKTDAKFVEPLKAEINGNEATFTIYSETSVTLSYKFQATPANAVTKIEISTQPSNLTYTHGDPLNLTGLSVKLTYDDATTATVAFANFGANIISTIPANGDTLSHTTHNGQSVQVKVGSLAPALTSKLTVNKATPTVIFPTAAPITYGMTLSQSALTGGSGTPSGTFAWQNGATVPTVTNSGYPVEFTPTDTDDYDYSQVTGWNSGTKKVVQNIPITVSKAAGANVGVPTITGDAGMLTITVTPLDPPGNGQIIEYAKNTSSTAPASGWQEVLLFNGLYTNTEYFIFARAKENENYNAGTASVSSKSIKFCIVTFISNGGTFVDNKYVISGDRLTKPEDPTKAGYGFEGWYKESTLNTKWDFSADTVTSTITLYAKWIENQYTLTISVEAITDPMASLTFPPITISRGAKTPVTYVVNVTGSYSATPSWEIEGVGAYSKVTGSGAEFTLNGKDVNYNTLGGHVLKLTVEKDGKKYQVNIPFTVVE